MKFYRQLIHILAMAIFTLFLSSCAKAPVAHRYNPYPLSATQYLQMADSAQGAKQQDYRLMAAGRYAQDHRATQAQRVLNSLAGQTLTPQQQAHKQLIQANIFLIRKNNSAAIDELKQLQASNVILSRSQQITLHRLLAKAYQRQGDIPNSINQRSALLPLLPAAQQQADLKTIWKSVQPLSQANLQNLIAQTPSANLRGWFTLALINKEASRQPQQLLANLSTWKQQNPAHPANALLPSKIKQARTAKPAQHIALLVPTTGQLASAGTAIRNGFFAAYYQAKKENTNAPTITVYNTADQPILSVYQKALSQGADFVVGPLTKSNITTLSQSSALAVPTLALNTIDKEKPVAHFYQFGLSPLDEAQQIALRAWDQHDVNAAIIAPDNSWGTGIANAFSKQWLQLGGRIVANLPYKNHQTLNSDIQQFLNITLAQKNKQDLRWLLREKFRYLPRRRQDIDMIFLIAQPSYARQILPLLKFYFAGDLPIYTTSTIYAGMPNARRDHDLNGLIFCDMPWVLDQRAQLPADLSDIQQQINTIWHRSYQRHPKLYALGIDSFDVINKLANLKALPQFGMNAASGTLYLNNQGHLYRELQWAQMRNGKPTLLH